MNHTAALVGRGGDGAFELVVSPLVLDEVEGAPEPVQRLLEELATSLVRVDIEEDAYDLQQAYLGAGVVVPRWATDALHVAVASVTACRVIVSWNFKHIVNFRRIPLYNAANQMQGHGPIAIHTPPEVVLDEESREGL